MSNLNNEKKLMDIENKYRSLQKYNSKNILNKVFHHLIQEKSIFFWRIHGEMEEENRIRAWLCWIYSYFIDTDNLSLKFKTWALDITVPKLFNLWAIN